MRAYFLFILFLSSILSSVCTAQTIDDYKTQFEKADSIMSVFYGLDVMKTYISLDSNSSYFMHNEGKAYKESVEINGNLNFTPNYFLLSYDLFHPSLKGDTLFISFMINSSGEFANQYFLLSSLIDFEAKSILSQDDIKESLARKLKKDNFIKEIKLGWSLVEYYRITQRKKKLNKERIIWLVTISNSQNEQENIAIDAYTGKRIWKKTTANKT